MHTYIRTYTHIYTSMLHMLIVYIYGPVYVASGSVHKQRCAEDASVRLGALRARQCALVMWCALVRMLRRRACLAAV